MKKRKINSRKKKNKNAINTHAYRQKLISLGNSFVLSNERERRKKTNQFIFAQNIHENTIKIRESIALVDIILTVQMFLIDQLMLTKTNKKNHYIKYFKIINIHLVQDKLLKVYIHQTYVLHLSNNRIIPKRKNRLFT